MDIIHKITRFRPCATMALPVTMTHTRASFRSRFSCEFREVGVYQLKLFRSPLKFPPLHWLNCECFRRISRRTKSLDFQLRESLILSSVQEKEAEDGFIQNISEDTDYMYDHLFDK